ncbi:MAG: hypothetical protein KGL10_05070 [Alphaproteobacteria bacterium]|nr:hypothetical protein [Alphaproteobacteria bacterium]MDE2336663.1 hypothetical protein [Alphaproteobacteria bacterium]
MHLHEFLFNPDYRYHIARYYVTAALLVVPFARIFTRAGFRPYWAVLLGVPDVGLALCILALALQKWNGKGANA